MRVIADTDSGRCYAAVCLSIDSSLITRRYRGPPRPRPAHPWAPRPARRQMDRAGEHCTATRRRCWVDWRLTRQHWTLSYYNDLTFQFTNMFPAIISKTFFRSSCIYLNNNNYNSMTITGILSYTNHSPLRPITFSKKVMLLPRFACWFACLSVRQD